MDGKERINEMYAFVAIDSDGTEGVCSFYSRAMSGHMPMVGADTARVDLLRPIAQDMAKQMGVPIRVLRFTVREEIEVIEP